LALKVSSASTIGVRQCAALHKQCAALHQFPPTLPIIWAQAAEECFLETQDVFPLKKNIQRLNTKALAID
jgi:hypothetical protein